MKKFIASIVASTALFGAQTAMAQHSNPYVTPAAPLEFQGDFVVSKGPVTLNCVINMKFSGPNNAGDGVAPSHTDIVNLSAAVTFVSGTGCTVLTINPIPAGNVTYNTTTDTLTLNSVYVNTSAVPGDCQGNVDAVWDQVSQSFIATGSLPAVTPGTGNCTLDGELLKVSPAGTVTFLP